MYAPIGVLTVETAGGRWTVPPARAVWIPATVAHQLTAVTRAHLRTIYASRRVRGVPRIVTVIDVSPLLRELILRIVGLERADARRDRLARVLFDELATVDVVPIDLPTPEHDLARAAADRLRQNPALPLDALCQELSTSRRTLERHFATDDGMTLGEWRQRAQLARAIELLATGHSVTSVALAVGYSTTSGFISAFHRRLGTTPGTYFDRPELSG